MSRVRDFLVKLLFAVVNFFIYVGEFTKYIFLLPFRIIVRAHRILNRAIVNLVNRLKKFPTWLNKTVKKIGSFRLPTIKLKLSLPRPRIKSNRFSRFLSFYLISKPRKFFSTVRENIPA